MYLVDFFQICQILGVRRSNSAESVNKKNLVLIVLILEAYSYHSELYQTETIFKFPLLDERQVHVADVGELE